MLIARTLKDKRWEKRDNHKKKKNFNIFITKPQGAHGNKSTHFYLETTITWNINIIVHSYFKEIFFPNAPTQSQPWKSVSILKMMSKP